MQSHLSTDIFSYTYVLPTDLRCAKYCTQLLVIAVVRVDGREAVDLILAVGRGDEGAAVALFPVLGPGGGRRSEYMHGIEGFLQCSAN